MFCLVFALVHFQYFLADYIIQNTVFIMNGLYLYVWFDKEGDIGNILQFELFLNILPIIWKMYGMPRCAEEDMIWIMDEFKQANNDKSGWVRLKSKPSHRDLAMYFA